ncbi:CDC73 protein, putative, partial [Ixodes scapularis]
TEGFKIDTMGTYHGMNLKSVTEGTQPKRPVAPAPAPVPVPAAPSSTAAAPAPRPVPKRERGVRGILNKCSRKTKAAVKGATWYLILHTVCTRFVSTAEKKSQGCKRENAVLIQRRRNGGTTVSYRVIDNPTNLASEDWPLPNNLGSDLDVGQLLGGSRDVVVAYKILHYQCLGLTTDELGEFVPLKAFHLKWDEITLDSNVAKWAVHVIQLSKQKRHLDRANLLNFWEVLD